MNQLENPIKRNVTIENLKGENDDLKRRLDRIDKDYKKAVEQRDQFHIEAQQAADSSMLEQQLDDYRDRVDSLEQSTRDKDDQIHQVRYSMIRVRHAKIQSHVIDLTTIYFDSILPTHSNDTFEISSFAHIAHFGPKL